MDIVTGTFIDSLPVWGKLSILALLLVVIIFLVVWVIRRILNGSAKSKHQIQPSRLAVVDAANIDGHRRLVLIRRDDVEHLVLIGGASDVLIESNIGGDIGSPLEYQQVAHDLNHETVLEEYAEEPNAEVSEFDDIFSPNDTVELANETPDSPPATITWREKAGSAAVLATAGLSAGQTDQNDVSPELSTTSEQQVSGFDTSNKSAEESFSELTSVLDSELAKTSDIGEQNPEINPPSLSSPDKIVGGEGSHDNQVNSADASSELPNKQDMEDEMQRLLNELTGEKA